ncbi:hypothetical protein E2320_007208 [Naja naja]|nr:hypothetical protein E2320_007208 [Naja naja]
MWHVKPQAWPGDGLRGRAQFGTWEGSRYVVAHVEENGHRLPVEWSPKCPAPSLETSWEEHLLEQQDHLEKEMEEAKRMISGLQALLLNGSLPEDEQERSLGLCEQNGCPEEQLIIIRSRLDQRCFAAEAGPARHVMLQIKQELLRANMDKEELHSQNKELSQKDRLLHQHQAKMEEMLHQLSEAGNHNSQSNGFLQSLGKGTASSTHRGRPAAGARGPCSSNSFSGHDPQHHTIDSLEQGISSLMERLHRMEVQKRQEKRPANVGNEYRESWPSNSKLPHSHSTPAVSSSACTKVLYFTDRSLTPFMVSIPKRFSMMMISFLDGRGRLWLGWKRTTERTKTFAVGCWMFQILTKTEPPNPHTNVDTCFKLPKEKEPQ